MTTTFHVTFQYYATEPEKLPIKFFGTSIPLIVTGYGNDGQNEGVSVDIDAEKLPEELKELAKAIPVPHITISIARGAKAVNTCNLEFIPIEPFEITGVFGGHA